MQKKMKSHMQKPSRGWDCRYGDSPRALKSNEMFRAEIQHLGKRAPLASHIAVGCSPLTDEPLEGTCTYVVRVWIHIQIRLLAVVPFPYAGVANDTHSGAVSHTCKIRILKHCILLLPPSPHIYTHTLIRRHKIWTT